MFLLGLWCGYEMTERYKIVAFLNKDDIFWVNDEGSSTLQEIYARRPVLFPYVILATPPEFLVSDMYAIRLDTTTFELSLGPTHKFNSTDDAVMAIRMGVLDGKAA